MEEISKKETEEYQSAPRKVSIFRKVFFNVLGFIGGYCVGAVALQIANWLFFDVLGRIGIIRSILSHPVDYSVYALTGVIFIDALVSLNTCGIISKLGKAKRNYSCYVLAAIRILNYIISLLASIKTNGFNLEMVWTIIVSLVAFLVIMNATANNESLKNL